MEENIPVKLEHGNSQFHQKNFTQAEQLFSQFITSCLLSRKQLNVHTAPYCKEECDAASLARAYNNRGQIKYLRVDFHEAVDDYTAAIQADSHYEVPFYNRGLIRYRLGFFDDAVSDFQQALKLNPEFEDAKVSLRQTLLDRQQKTNRGY